MATESKLSAIEALVVGFTAAVTFVLGYGYWQLTNRLDEQDARLVAEMHQSEAALAQLDRTLGTVEELIKRLGDEPAPAAAPTPVPAQPTTPETETREWLVLLATVPGTDLNRAKQVANAKLTEAADLAIGGGVTIYRTHLKHNYVVVLGTLSAKESAFALAAAARRTNLAPDAYAEHADEWQPVGTAPFAVQITEASMK